MSNENLNVDIDSLLDGTLDDIADLPEFKPFPAGMHQVSIVMTQKEINKKPSIELAMTYVEPMELSDPSDVPPKAGDTSNLVFFLDNELGQGQFKEVIKALKPVYGTNGSNRDTMNESAGAVVAVVTKLRKDKNDETKVYTQLQKLELI